MLPRALTGFKGWARPGKGKEVEGRKERKEQNGRPKFFETWLCPRQTVRTDDGDDISFIGGVHVRFCHSLCSAFSQNFEHSNHIFRREDICTFLSRRLTLTD